MYTVTMQDKTGTETVSGTFETSRKARNWFNWLRTQNMTTQAALYRGQAGAELIERWVR